MRNITRLLPLVLLLCLPFESLYPHTPSSTEVYLLTCSPGTESYSMYGHSAIRVYDSLSGIDLVYNWGVFDFSTPNFTYKFARGRLDYMLGVYPYERFVKEYFFEERSVVSQKINLTDRQLFKLKELLDDNYREENRYYRYDFFMDNCATRIRDILELTVGNDLIYPVTETGDIPSYRDRIDEYQGGSFVWLDAGIDLLLGSPADNDCGFRESMFLPDYLMENMSATKVKSDSAAYLLLQEPVTVIEFEPPTMEVSLLKRPWLIVSVITLLLLFATFTIRKKIFHNIFDILFFGILFILAFLMIFTNYLTDHQAMGNNFNMVWLNPLLLLTPVIAFMKAPLRWFWRAQIVMVLVFMVLVVFIKQSVNPVFIPVMVLLIARSWYRLNCCN